MEEEIRKARADREAKAERDAKIKAEIDADESGANGKVAMIAAKVARKVAT